MDGWIRPPVSKAINEKVVKVARFDAKVTKRTQCAYILARGRCSRSRKQGVKLVTIEAEADSEIAQHHSVVCMPTIPLLDNGEVVKRQVGLEKLIQEEILLVRPSTISETSSSNHRVR